MRKNPLKWYTHILKSGEVKLQARDKKGRIKKWEKSTTLDRPKGEYKRINIILNFIPTKGDRSTPTSKTGDNFEVNLELPEDDYDDDDIWQMGVDALVAEGFPEEMIESCGMDIKQGKDFVGYSHNSDTSYKIIDLARPQYHYPRTGRGLLYKGEDEEEIDE